MQPADLDRIVEEFRNLVRTSEARLPLPTPADARPALQTLLGVTLAAEKAARERIAQLVGRKHPDGLNRHAFFLIEKTYALEVGLGLPSEGVRTTIGALYYGFPQTDCFADSSDPNWPQAIDFLRTLAALGQTSPVNDRTKAVADAGARLQQAGFRLRSVHGGYELDPTELARATEAIQSSLDQIGLRSALDYWSVAIGQVYGRAFGLTLFGRQRSQLPSARAPSSPFGFLFNLIVRVPDLPTSSGASALFVQALELARDLIAVLDVEPYSQFENLGVGALLLDRIIRETLLCDHWLFFQQWPPAKTAYFLRHFFGTDYQTEMASQLGWTVDDVVKLWKTALASSPPFGPVVLEASVLQGSGLSPTVLSRLLGDFVHTAGTINRNYSTPLAAKEEGQMAFVRPLYGCGLGRNLLPDRAMAGPAFYEATMAALRKIQPPGSLNNFMGKAMERLVVRLLADAGMPPSHQAAIYRLAGFGDGECDLILETATHIVFIECKAKALTRKAMSDEPGSALLDFGDSILTAYVQALRHERILRERGRIDFVAQPALDWCGRKIVHLGISLLDLGSLQERMTIIGLWNGFLSAEVNCGPGYARASKIADLNLMLQQMRTDVAWLDQNGCPARQQRMGIRSLSVGQLAVILDGVSSTDELIAVLGRSVTYGSLNPLLELYHQSQTKLSNWDLARAEARATA
jgi:hypothetical protein